MESIGDYLRAAREERKIPIAQVSRDTKVNEKYILALEAGDFSVFPAVAYAKGFIRIYAEYLGVDPRPLVEQYMEQHAGLARQALPFDLGPVATRVMPGSGSYTAIAVGVVVVAAAIVAYNLKPWKMLERKAVARPPAETEELETLPLPSLPTAPPPPAVIPTSAPVAETVPAKKKLLVRAKENVVMKVYADKSLLFQGTIHKGKEEYWLASDSFDCRISKPRAVDLVLDGKSIKDLKGKEPQNIFIDKDGKMVFYKGKLREE